MVPAATLYPTAARADYWARIAALESELGLTRVDNLDGTSHDALLSGLSTADRVGALFTWRYVGQANYAWTPTGASMPLSADDDQDTGDDPSAGLDDLADTVTVDKYGRKWRVVGIDPVAVNYAIADYWADVQATAGLETPPTGPEPAQDLDALSSALEPNHATSWTFADCVPDPDGDVDLGIWDGESRTSFASPTTSPHGRAALVAVDGPYGWCSGVKVAHNLVLTAAHCVMYPGTTTVRNPVWLCPGAGSSGSDCVEGEATPNPRFRGLADTSTGNVRDDYAVVRFTAPLSNPRMFLSMDNRGAIKKRTPSRVGFDQHRLVGGTCATWPSDEGREHPAVSVRGTRSGLLRLRADASNGSSGGPYFFMHSGVGRVIGLQVFVREASIGSSFVGGPRVTEFRDWAIAQGAN